MKYLLLNGDELRLLQNSNREEKRGGSSFSGVLFQTSVLSHKEKVGICLLTFASSNFVKADKISMKKLALGNCHQ